MSKPDYKRIRKAAFDNRMLAIYLDDILLPLIQRAEKLERVADAARDIIEELKSKDLGLWLQTQEFIILIKYLEELKDGGDE